MLFKKAKSGSPKISLLNLILRLPLEAIVADLICSLSGSRAFVSLTSLCTSVSSETITP